MPDPFTNYTLDDGDFRRLAAFIEGHLGIRMPDTKKTMLESRLQRRARQLGCRTLREYLDRVFGEREDDRELLSMIDAVTTNKTDFFREADHFDYLYETVLPYLLARGRRQISVWSAGCSTGEEPYSLAMTLELFRDAEPGLAYDLTATDISTTVLETARQGVYAFNRIGPIPDALLRRFFLRSRNRADQLVRVKAELRACVTFARLNLNDPESYFRKRFDVIFFRNVIIYFNKDAQQRILGFVLERLREDGFLFLGHSETLCGLGLPVIMTTSTVYRHAAAGTRLPEIAGAAARPSPVRPWTERPATSRGRKGEKSA